MKRILTLTALLCFVQLNAQNSLSKSDDISRIVLTAYIPPQVEGLTESSRSMIQNKMNQIVTKNGLGGTTANQRFIITCNVAVLTKDITPTAPPMHAYTLEVTFYIGDGINGSLFSSKAVTIKGVGETETKAYSSALKNIKADNPELQQFVSQGKSKIIEYYNSQCDFLLKEAATLDGQAKYDEAIYKLVSVPEVCKACYDRAMEAAGPIFQHKIDLECKRQLNEAQATWFSTQNVEGAQKTAAMLGKVNPNSSCFKEANGMLTMIYNEIKDRVKDIDEREWNLAMKIQQDNVDLEAAAIKAYRDVGVAYGNGQPDTVSYNTIGWW
jgi:hypothetical protein